MEKFADMTQLQNKLQIVSACALDHVKGFIIVEADKQQDIYEVSSCSFLQLFPSYWLGWHGEMFFVCLLSIYISSV